MDPGIQSPLPEPGPYSRHVPALDGVRGFAVLGVMASHLFAGNAPGRLGHAFQSLCSFGAHGVDLFFVLSGFLITGILYDSLGDPHFFRKFYARRSLRIFPLYYGVLAVLFLLTRPLHLQWQHMQWVLLLYLQNTNLVQPFYLFTPSPTININHLWSLAVEEQFYLVWPLLVFLLVRPNRILRVCFSLSVVALLLRLVLIFLGTNYNTVNRFTLCRADSLLIGAALALLLRGPHHDRALRLAPHLLAFCSALFIGFLFLPALLRSSRLLTLSNNLFLAFGYTLLALISAALIALCLREDTVLVRFFSNPALRFYGKISYGLYVLHFIALPFMITTFRHWFEAVSPNKYLSVGGSSLLAFVVSTVAAVLSYHLYEKQFLRLKHLFAYNSSASIAQRASGSERTVSS